MKRLKISKALIYAIIGTVVIEASFMTYSMVNNQFFNREPQAAQQPEAPAQAIQETPAPEVVDTSKVQIPEEIQDIIRQSDPANFEKNLNNYKTLLVKLDVHDSSKAEIERLLKGGYKIADILTAYDFLYDCYGKKEELEPLVQEKTAGKNWADTFKQYNSKNPEFVPKAFEPDYLEALMKTPGITKDDIMIADRVAQKISKPMKEVMELRLSAKDWKEINASLNILNSQRQLPYVPVTAEQVKKYTSGKLSEQQVVEDLVTAHKMGKTAQEIVDRAKNGLTREQLYAWCYETKYY